jgi:hypothetical protein
MLTNEWHIKQVSRCLGSWLEDTDADGEYPCGGDKIGFMPVLTNFHLFR